MKKEIVEIIVLIEYSKFLCTNVYTERVITYDGSNGQEDTPRK